MKLGQLIERFPGIVNYDVTEYGNIYNLQDSIEEFITADVARQEKVCEKIVNIIKHHARQVGGELVFCRDRADFGKIYASLTAPELKMPIAAGVSVCGKHEEYRGCIGEALAAARAFECLATNLLFSNEIDEHPEIVEAFEKVMELSNSIF